MTHLSVPYFWRLNKAKYLARGSRCLDCGRSMFPPRRFCVGCGGERFEAFELGIGQIVSWTIIHASPDGFEAPYTVALVGYEDGVVVPGIVVGDHEKLAMGAPVRPVIRRLGENDGGLLLYGFKFELI